LETFATSMRTFKTRNYL